MTRNQIDYAKYKETQRSNLANEAENYRSHVATETETKRSNLAREAETARSNKVREAETERSNKARETETNRHNVRTSTETERHNFVQEQLDRSRIAESARHNQAEEGIKAAANYKDYSPIAQALTDAGRKSEVTGLIANKFDRAQQLIPNVGNYIYEHLPTNWKTTGIVLDNLLDKLLNK